MAAANTIDKKISFYLAHLNDQQKKAVLSVVKSFAKEEEPWWDDKSYIKEMDRRFAELESGEVKGLTPEEMEANAKKNYKKVRAI
jgi:hypothetical protein